MKWQKLYEESNLFECFSGLSFQIFATLYGDPQDDHSHLVKRSSKLGKTIMRRTMKTRRVQAARRQVATRVNELIIIMLELSSASSSDPSSASSSSSSPSSPCSSASSLSSLASSLP